MEEKWRNRDKRVLDDFRMPKLQEIFTTAGHRVSLLRETRIFEKFLRYSSSLSSEGVEKRFGETVYKKDKEEKKK